MRDILSVLSMAIIDTEVVSEITSIHIRRKNEAILVYFVRIVGDETYSGGEGVLCDNISFYVLNWRRSLRNGRRGVVLLS